MAKVNFFDAYLIDKDDKSVQFTVLVPGDVGPEGLSHVVTMILSGDVFFAGGCVDNDYFEDPFSSVFQEGGEAE